MRGKQNSLSDTQTQNLDVVHEFDLDEEQVGAEIYNLLTKQSREDWRTAAVPVFISLPWVVA